MLLLMLSPQDCKPKVSQVASRFLVLPPWFLGGVRSGLVCQSRSRLLGFYTLRGQLGPLLDMADIRWLPSVPSMPKRVSAYLSQPPAAGVDAFESIEPRRRRLLPQSTPPAQSQLLTGSPCQRGRRTPSSAALTGPMLRCCTRLAAVLGRKPPRPSETPTPNLWCKSSSWIGTPLQV